MNYQEGLYPRLPSPEDNQTEVLKALIPLMKNMNSKNDQHIPLTMLPPKPGKKDVVDGLEEFWVILRSTGKWDGHTDVLAIEHHGIVQASLKELVDASDFDVMLNHYARTLEGKSFKKAHEVNLKHVEEAIRGIINKNSGEIAIK